MACQTCDQLFGAYKSAVKLYSLAMRDMAGLVGEDFQLALKGLEQLRQKCRDADDAFTEHWREQHRGLAAKAASS
jgi:hypothetical protein